MTSLQETGFVSAILKWDPSTERSSGGTVSNTGTCIAKMYRATEAWLPDSSTPGEALTWSFPGESGTVPAEKDVSVIVRGWLTGSLPNHGFFFVGPNENVNEKNNNRCLTTLSNLRLEVSHCGGRRFGELLRSGRPHDQAQTRQAQTRQAQTRQA